VDIEITSEQVQKLNTLPSEQDYDIRADGKIYLKKDYYFRRANEIFGWGGWSVTHDSSSVRYETHLHPKTGEPVGVVCYVQTTVTTRFSLPRTVVGFAAVQFGKASGSIKPEQQVDVYVLALRAAEARGLKDALASFGPAFIVDMKGGKKKAQPVVQAAPKPVPVPAAVAAIPARPAPEKENQDWFDDGASTATDFASLYDEASSKADWRQVNGVVKKALEEKTITQHQADTVITPAMTRAAERLGIQLKQAS
jgi:hypothetical protein